MHTLYLSSDNFDNGDRFMERIAFVGLGNMGAPMAKNLLSAGLSVNVFDLISELARPLAEFGANVCETIEMALGAHVRLCRPAP